MQETRIKERWVLKSYVKKKIIKALWVTVIVLIGMIAVKGNSSLKEGIKEMVFEKSIPMIKFRNIYKEYFDGSEQEKKVESVFHEKLNIKKEEKTETGVKLTVREHEQIPNLESGILILIDNEKAIIEQIDGVSAIYNNIDIKNYKVYDYLEKGDILGEASGNEIQISFEKKGEYYDYKKYL